jgi:hypothetical protein
VNFLAFQGRFRSLSKYSNPGIAIEKARIQQPLSIEKLRHTGRVCSLPSGERDACALQKVRKKVYECKTRPDDLAFRKASNARPSKPVPRSSKEDGSGVGFETRLRSAKSPWIPLPGAAPESSN